MARTCVLATVTLATVLGVLPHLPAQAQPDRSLEQIGLQAGLRPAGRSSPRPPAPVPMESSIRNATDAWIRYTIRPDGSTERPNACVLRAGQVDRYTHRSTMEIGLERQGRLVAYDLVPGTHCAVRRDSQGRLGLYLGSHGRTDVPDLGPFVPTPKEVVERALKLAGVSAADVVYDLGCGDGRIVIEAARRYGARGVGVDLDPRLVRESQEAARAAAVERLVAFRAGDATQCDVTAATVVFMYLVPEANALLRPRLEAQLRPGSRVVSHDYPVPGWTAARAEIFEPGTGKKHYIFLYVMKK